MVIIALANGLKPIKWQAIASSCDNPDSRCIDAFPGIIGLINPALCFWSMKIVGLKKLNKDEYLRDL